MIDERLCACEPVGRLDRPGGNPRCRFCGKLVHIESDSVPSREAVLLLARARFPGRPVVVHRGSWADREHQVDTLACPCGPELVMPPEHN